MKIWLFTLWEVYLARLSVEKPESVQSLFNFKGKPGSIQYSISTFGEIQYNESFEMKLIVAGSENEMGCAQEKNFLFSGDSFIYMVSKGSCNYSKKAFEAQ